MNKESPLQAVWRLNRTLPLLLAALLLLNVGTYALLTQFVAPRVNALERRYIDQQALLRQLSRGGGEQRPASAYRQGLKDLEAFREAIPEKAEFTALVGEIFTLAERSGLGIHRVGYDPKEVSEQRLLRYTLNFSVTGNYGQIKKFIHLLEQSPRLIAIEELSLGAGGEPGADEVALRLRLSTFFQAEAP